MVNRQRRAHVVVLAAVSLSAGAGCAAKSTTATSIPGPVSPSPAPSASPKYSDEPSPGAQNQPCGEKLTPDAAAAAKLPTGFPPVGGFVATYTVQQGSSVLVRGFVTGTPADITRVRDSGFVKIRANGYTVTGSDQEPGFEADGDFTGPHPGNINVKTLCQGHLVVSYTFTG